MDGTGPQTQDGGLEKRLWTQNPLLVDGEHLTVGWLAALLGEEEEVVASPAASPLPRVELLLDVTRDFPLSHGGEAVARHHEVPASQVQTQEGWGRV